MTSGSIESYSKYDCDECDGWWWVVDDDSEGYSGYDKYDDDEHDGWWWWLTYDDGDSHSNISVNINFLPFFAAFTFATASVTM